LITETLSPSCDGVLISDSALKVVFLTTLYVDVKEPAVHHILTTKKLNLAPTKITACRRGGFCFRCRDKIEPNLQSQNVRRTHSKLVESRVQRDQKPTPNRRRVNHIYQNSRNFQLRHNFYRLSGLYYLCVRNGLNARRSCPVLITPVLPQISC
jgi:hypothetical protein